jgi:hypothetical protein
MARTIKIAKLIEMVNRSNRDSTCSAGVREGWNSLLGEVLHATDNYAGFGYLSATEVPKGEEPGIAGTTPNCVFPDETRRRYIVHRRLRA